jgi:hypothetical protein
MKENIIQFPQYRMLSNKKSLYKILDDRNFEEIQFVGSKKKRYVILAEQYPEILKIQDMLTLFEGVYVKINEDEWLKNVD